MTTLNFDATDVKPCGTFEAIPAGWYNSKIFESEMKPTNDKTGSYLQLGLEIIEGEHAGRKFTDRLNLQNKNPVAVEIAEGTLSAICHATGVIQVGVASELHNIPLQMKLNVKPAEIGDDGNQYEAKNEVKAYKPVEGGGAGPAGSADDGAPSWAKAKEEPAAEEKAAAPKKEAPKKETPTSEEMPLEMTDKAGGATLEAFRENDWTDDELIREGYAVRKEAPKKEAPKKETPAAEAGEKKAPPWAKK